MLPLKDQIDMELRKVVSVEVFDEWMNSPNVELDFKTPRQLMARQDYGPLWKLIYHHRNEKRLVSS